MAKKDRAPSYLEVKFGDNDFGNEVAEALKKLWYFVKYNHCDNYSHEKQKVADCFVLLDKQEVLHKLLTQLIDAERIITNVEVATRFIHHAEILADQIKPFTSLTTEYLKIKLAFHKDKKFAEEWNNSESAYLVLRTGKVRLF
jgi:hypothetical protein